MKVFLGIGIAVAVAAIGGSVLYRIAESKLRAALADLPGRSSVQRSRPISTG